MNRSFSRPASARGRNRRSPQSFGGGRRSQGRNSRGGSRGGGGGRNFKKIISHDKFINLNPKKQEQETYVAQHTFADFGFIEALVENLTKKGYVTPTRVQDESIPYVLEGRDVIGLSNTGSGKTAAFVLPIIQKLKVQKNAGQVLIISPTRELAKQIQDEFKQFAERMGLHSTLCVGGMNIQPQIRGLRQGPQVVIGTPGRLKDLITRRQLRLDKTTTLVLDEADRMLDMGFLPDIKQIIAELPQERQSLCFSATVTPAISKLLDELLSNPVTISVRTSETGEHISQDIIKTRGKEEKLAKLIDMLSQDHFEKVLVFGEMKHSVQKLADGLTKEGFPSAAIHGNKSQVQRQRALDAFKSGKVNILVATDVAARGLDIPNVSHVINFDTPQTHEEYVHRIGRTGRAGKEGQAYTFV